MRWEGTDRVRTGESPRVTDIYGPWETGRWTGGGGEEVGEESEVNWRPNGYRTRNEQENRAQ